MGELGLELTLYPGPILRKVSEPVETFDEQLKELVEAMFELMDRSKGVGLAAPQVGRRTRILVVNATGEEQDRLVLINPALVERTGPETVFEEGCLSFPGIYADVTRSERCLVEAVDLEGVRTSKEYDGFESRIIQHEYDHLEGVLLVDRMSPADKLRHKAALAELVDDYRQGNGRSVAERS